jgi:hypothetical protein
VSLRIAHHKANRVETAVHLRKIFVVAAESRPPGVFAWATSILPHNGHTGGMKVHLGATMAHCPGCDSASFDFADASQALREWPELVCCFCGQSANHEELIMQIGAKAIRSAVQALLGKAG